MRDRRVLSRNKPSTLVCQRQTQVLDLPVWRTLSAISRTIWARKTCICAALRSAITARRRRRTVGETAKRDPLPCANELRTPLGFKFQILSAGTMRALSRPQCDASLPRGGAPPHRAQTPGPVRTQEGFLARWHRDWVFGLAVEHPTSRAILARTNEARELHSTCAVTAKVS